MRPDWQILLEVAVAMLLGGLIGLETWLRRRRGASRS